MKESNLDKLKNIPSISNKKIFLSSFNLKNITYKSSHFF